MNNSSEPFQTQGAGERISRPFTLVQFRVLPPLYQLHGQTLVVPSEVGTALLHLRIVDSYVPSWLESADKRSTSVPGDDVGLIHNSIVEVALPGVVSLQPARQLEPGNVPEGQQYVLRVLNHVIQHYRVLAGVSQIRPVKMTHGLGFKFTYFLEDGTAKTGIVMGRNALPPDGEAADVPDPDTRISEAIKHAALTGPQPLWATLKEDAFADFDSGDERSALAHLYMSFEVLAYQAYCHLAKVRPGTGGDEDFPPEPGTELRNAPAIADMCFDFHPGGYSRSRIGELSAGLLRYRDEVLLGQNTRLTSKAVDEVLACYLELKDWLAGALSSEDRSGEN